MAGWWVQVKPVLRPGKFGDIPGIWAMMEAAHTASRYADLPLDPKAGKGLLMHSIQRAPRSTTVIVADNDGTLEGFIVGIAMPLYQIFAVKEATDLFWHAAPGAHAATATRLLRAFHKWASAAPGVVTIRQGNSDSITPAEGSARIMERSGMRRTGFVYEKEVGQR